MMPTYVLRAVSTVLIVLLAMSGPPHEAAAQDTDEARPPLIDRDLFFGNPTYAGADISPDGAYIAFRSDYRGTMNVWVKGIDESFEAARPVTADTTRPVSGYFWTQDSERILYVQDKGGDENYHVYAVDPEAEAEEATGVPPARDLTPYENVQARIYAVPEATPGQIVVGLNDRDPQYHDVYRLDLETGERTLLVQNDANVAGWQTDLEGNVRLAVRQDSEGGTEILRVEDDSLMEEPVYTCSVFESCGPVRFHKDGERVYMTTNQGDDVDLQRLVLFNPRTGEEEVVESDPEGEVDFGGTVFSDATDELLATYYVGDRLRYYPKDEQFEEDLETVRSQVPEGEIYFGASTNDETKHIVRVQRDVDSGSTYLYDREAGTVERLYQSRPDLPSEHLAPMQAIRYTARDGLEIPAYLTLPEGAAAENMPVVVMPHGGPWARDTWGYNPYAQFFANRGYAVLQPNFRGSTGYGQEFLNAGNEEWGTGAMQHDITDGVQHLIDEGIADPERIGIFGGSYGGYATLAGLAFTPDVYAAGISFVGPSNIITLLESIPPYWAPIQRIFDVRVGDLDDPEERARLREQSPLFAANQIDDPLMVIQGANDPRVKKRESDQIVVAARENDVPVQYLVAENEGHGFANEDNRLASAAAMERFFAEHLGGRYQEETSDEITATLDALQVDVSTVEMPDTTAAEADAGAAPLAEADGTTLEPVTITYETSLQAQGRDLTLTTTRTLSEATYEGAGAWQVVDRTTSQMVNATDSLLLDRETLRPRYRHIAGNGTIELTYADDQIAGEINVMGQTMPIEQALDGPVFAGGAGLEAVMAALPFTEEYEATIRVFNPQQQSIRRMKLTVAGAEMVEVPAGSFETYVVELTSLDGDDAGTGTYHVMQDAPHYVVQSETSLGAQMGGATATTQLTAFDGEQ